MTESSLSELAGHDRDAQHHVALLVAHYRREGLTGLRAYVTDRYPRADADEAALIVEAVLTIAERTGSSVVGRRAWEDFESADAADEAERIRRGGGR